MDIKKHLEEIKNFQIKLEIEYLANITKHKETLSKLMDNCQLKVDKDDTQKTKDMKDEISSNTNEILEYEDHLYRTKDGGIMWKTDLGEWMAKKAFKFDVVLSKI